jgi:hypothetical protein
MKIRIKGNSLRYRLNQNRCRKVSTPMATSKKLTHFGAKSI